MLAFFYRCVNGIRQLAGLVVPFFSKPRDFHTWHNEIRWSLRILLFLVAFILLLVLNWILFERGYLRLTAFQFLKNDLFPFEYTWIPILFTLLLAIAWVAWWVWRVFWEAEVSVFPDIDEAWNEAMVALHRARLDLNDLQVYLVHGQPKGGEQALFKAANLQLLVDHAPDRVDAPLHVFATRDELFVTCAGASLLAPAAACLNAEPAEEDFDPATTAEEGGKSQNLYQTVAAGGDTSTYNEVFEQIRALRARAEREGRSQTDEEQEELRVLERRNPMAKRKKAVSLTPVAKDMQLHLARLRHLCRLIVRDRKPYCPINGSYVLVPLAAAEGDAHFGQIGTFVARELANARAVLQVVAPLLVIVCDWETLPGFTEFTRGMEEKDRDARRRRRFGQEFKMVPAMKDPVKVMQSLEMTLRWTFVNRLTKEVYKLFKLEKGKADAYSRTIRENGQLYRFLHAMRRRESRLANLIAQGVLDPEEENHFVLGCYLIGSGKMPREQAFAPATIDKLLACKGDHVSWTAAGFAEEAALDRWTWIGYVVCGLVILGAVAVVAVTQFSTLLGRSR